MPYRTALSLLGLTCLLPCVSAQVDWVDVTPPVSPARGAHHRYMTYDSVRQRVLLLVGTVTWEWDGLAWYERTRSSPPPREKASLAFDRNRGRAVLFGGRLEGTSDRIADTWEWDGTVWIRRGLGIEPPPRVEAAMAWDPVSGRVLLAGGNGVTGNQRDNWSWNGTTWTQMLSLPQVLQDVRMAFDPTRGRLLLLGNTVTERWYFSWTGQAWQALPNSGDPVSLELAYDPFRRTLLALTGNRVDEFTGAEWTPMATRTWAPVGALVAATDEARQQVVALSRDDDPLRTWVLVTDLRRVAAGHAVGSLPLLAQSAPRIGQRMYLSFPSSAGFGLLLVGPSPCDTPLALVGLPLFCAQGTVFVQPWIPVTSTGTPAVVMLDLPADPSFLDLRACMQGMALESGSCLRLTDVGETRLRLR